MAVAVLRHEQELRWEFEKVVPSSVGTIPIDPAQDLNLRLFARHLDVRQIVKLRSLREIPIRHRVAAAKLLDSRCRVLLATDRDIHFLNSIAELCPRVHQVIVCHGVLKPLNLPRLRITRGYPNRSVFVWGRREEELLRSIGLNDLRIHRLGSLRNAIYLSENHVRAEPESSPGDRICLISSFVGLERETQRQLRADDRWELRQFLLRAVNMLVTTIGVPVLVALKPQTMYRYSEGEQRKWLEEREYFRVHLPECDVTFTDPIDRFATYKAVDESLLSVGLFDGSVVEGFGRGRVVLSASPEKLTERFGALPDQFHITERSIAEFTRSAHSRLADQYRWIRTREGVDMRRYYIEEAESSGPVARLAAVIESLIDD